MRWQRYAPADCSILMASYVLMAQKHMLQAHKRRWYPECGCRHQRSAMFYAGDPHEVLSAAYMMSLGHAAVQPAPNHKPDYPSAPLPEGGRKPSKL
jgi:hypothetical protein